nr:hypothetical protein [Rhodococcus sp. 06-412-2B]
MQNLILEETELSYGARFLYVLLSVHVSYADVANDATAAEVYPSMNRLAKMMGYAKPTKKFYDFREELRTAGLLSWVGHVNDNGGQGSNRYTLIRKLPSKCLAIAKQEPSGSQVATPPLETGYPLPLELGTPSPESGIAPTQNQGYEVEPLEVEPLNESQGIRKDHATPDGSAELSAYESGLLDVVKERSDRWCSTGEMIFILRQQIETEKRHAESESRAVDDEWIVAETVGDIAYQVEIDDAFEAELDVQRNELSYA